MRILFLSENFPPETNAAATRVYERACHWVRAGHEVTVLTQAPNFPQGRLHDGWRNAWRQTEMMDGIRVVRVKTYIAANEGFARRTLDFVSYMLTALLFGLFEKRPDVVCSTSPQFFAAVGGWMLAALRRRPFVFELGDLWPASIVAVGAMRDSKVLRAIERLELFLYRRAACVVALTEAFKRDLVRRGIPAGKIAVVMNGVDAERYGPRPRDAELEAQLGLAGKFVIGYVGTHGLAHALERVLDAAELLRGDDRIRFLFAGPGAARAMLVAETAKRGLPNVVFLDAQPKSRVPAVWSLCDVALVHLKDTPVFAEVIPSKVFEAMAMGLPILIAAPEGEATAIVRDSGAGVCAPAEDPAALAGAARGMAGDAAALKRLAGASLAAAPRYSRAYQARAMIAALDAAANGAGADAAARVAAVEAAP
jgi:colanic acid biosynthesis glycosyl transferase WcaI